MNVTKYVGIPWREDFTCWGLVRLVQAQEFGRSLPDLQVGEHLRAAQERILLELIGKEGVWRKKRTADAGDIMVCRSTDGPHVGVMVGRTRVLHNVGSRSRPGNTRLDRIADLPGAGFQRIEFWGPHGG